jgi:hypothetical protein
MKPRPVHPTTTGFDRAQRPATGDWPPDEKPNPFDDPEDKTPVAPPPSLAMLASAGAPWYSRHRYLLIGVGGLFLILLAFVGGLRASSPPPSVVPAVAVATPLPLGPAPAPVAAPLADTIVLSVTVSPPTAQVLLDGQLMPSNPFLTRFPRSAATHRLRAAAPGFQAKERWISFADNVMLDLSLSPVDPSAAPGVRDRGRRHDPPTVRHPPALITAPPVVLPAPAHHPEIGPRPEADKPRRRRIESTDPYAGDQ